jgi:hypothetical protein
MNKAAYKNNVYLYKKKDEVNKELTLSKNINRAAGGLWIYKMSLILGEILGRLMPNIFGWMKLTIKILGASGAWLIIKPSLPLSNKVTMLPAASTVVLDARGEPLTALETLLSDPQAMEEINRRLLNGIADRLIDPSSTYALDELKMLILEDLGREASDLTALCLEGVNFAAITYSLTIVGLYYLDFEKPWKHFVGGAEIPISWIYYLKSYLFKEGFDSSSISFGLWMFWLVLLFLDRCVVPKFPNLYAQYASYGKELIEVEAARSLDNEEALTEMIKEILGSHIIEEPVAIMAQQEVLLEPAQVAILGSEPYVNLAFNSLFNVVTYVPNAVYELLALSGSFPYAFIWLLYLALTLTLIWKLLTKIKSSIKKALKPQVEEKIGGKRKKK